MKVLDLFAGIGGFSLGFKRAGGFQTVAFCEIDADCQLVLKKNFQGVPIYGDIQELTLPQGFADVVMGGFPCQDLSAAGKQKGLDENTRSGLWWQMRRIISEVRPKFAVMENVPNFISGERGKWFGDFLGSLAEIGYDAEWTCISAAAVGKPHLRERVWVVAYPSGKRFNPILEKIDLPQSNAKRRDGAKTLLLSDTRGRPLSLIPEHLRIHDGVPVGLDEIKTRVKMCGNSIVPDIAYFIGKRIKEAAK